MADLAVVNSYNIVKNINESIKNRLHNSAEYSIGNVNELLINEICATNHCSLRKSTNQKCAVVPSLTDVANDATFIIPLWYNQPKLTFLPNVLNLAIQNQCRLIILFDSINDWNHIEKINKTEELLMKDVSFDVSLEKEVRDSTGTSVLTWVRTGETFGLMNAENAYKPTATKGGEVNPFVEDTLNSYIGYRCAMLRCEHLYRDKCFKGPTSWNAFNELYTVAIGEIRAAYDEVHVLAVDIGSMVSRVIPPKPIVEPDDVLSDLLPENNTMVSSSGFELDNKTEYWGIGNRIGYLVLLEKSIQRLICTMKELHPNIDVAYTYNGEMVENDVNEVTRKVKANPRSSSVNNEACAVGSMPSIPEGEGEEMNTSKPADTARDSPSVLTSKSKSTVVSEEVSLENINEDLNIADVSYNPKYGCIVVDPAVVDPPNPPEIEEIMPVANTNESNNVHLPPPPPPENVAEKDMGFISTLRGSIVNHEAYLKTTRQSAKEKLKLRLQKKQEDKKLKAELDRQELPQLALMKEAQRLVDKAKSNDADNGEEEDNRYAALDQEHQYKDKIISMIRQHVKKMKIAFRNSEFVHDLNSNSFNEDVHIVPNILQSCIVELCYISPDLFITFPQYEHVYKQLYTVYNELSKSVEGS